MRIMGTWRAEIVVGGNGISLKDGGVGGGMGIMGTPMRLGYLEWIWIWLED